MPIKSKKREIISVFILLILTFNILTIIPFSKENTTIDEKFNTELPLSNQHNSSRNFRYYKTITFDHLQVSGSVDLLDFPVLVSIYDVDLHDKAQSNGDDIAFFNSTGSGKLSHEIEYFERNFNSTHVKLITWVKVPILSPDTDTIIRMYYGNSTMMTQQDPEGVWQNEYAGIWHLTENPIGTIYDSTSSSFDGTPEGSMNGLDQVEGKIDGSLDFDGINDKIRLDNIPTDDWNAITLESWIKIRQYGDDRVFSKEEGTGNGPHIWMLGTSINNLKCRITTDGFGGGFSEIQSVSGLMADTWHHIAMKWDSSSGYFIGLIDGTERIQTGRGGSSISDSVVDSIIADQAAGVRQFDGIISEVRLSKVARTNDWILTGFTNQNDPSSFYTVSSELSEKINLQVNTIDVHSNLISNLNVSLYQNSFLIRSGITNSQGSVIFTDVVQGQYNFTVVMTSDIDNYKEIVNITTEAVFIDKSNENISLSWNVGINYFQVKDVDNLPVRSGWIIVGNDTTNLRNCSIDSNGETEFRWLYTTPFEYNYTIFYKNNDYNPEIVSLGKGSISSSNSLHIINTNFTTVNFTVIGSGKIVSGAKLRLSKRSNGENIVNLTTNSEGIATLRWFNSSGLDFGSIVEYSLRIDFFGERIFNSTTGGPPDTINYNFTISSFAKYEFIITINPDDYQTELISLNPSDNVAIEWGSILKARVMFNVTKAGSPPNFNLMDPADADSVTYKVIDGGTTVLTGILSTENYLGKYQGSIDTSLLESDKGYRIEISSLKSGFTPPNSLNLLLFVTLNHIEINNSIDTESLTEVYWLESANMSVHSFGENVETMVLQNQISVDNNDSFEFYIPEPQTSWNLSQISFNIYDITYGVSEPEININITDPFGLKHSWDDTNGDYYYEMADPGNGRWNDLIISLDKRSVTGDNTFNFNIEGTFLGPIRVEAEIIFIRDVVNIQYSFINVSETISIPYEDGWSINDITLEIFNCRNPSTGLLVNPESVIENITSNDGVIFGSWYDNIIGSGKINNNHSILYPIDNKFMLIVANLSNVIFDVNLIINYSQEFYHNPYLETLNSQVAIETYTSGNVIQISPTDFNWKERNSFLIIENLINSTLNPVLPSEVRMNVTIGTQTFQLQDGTILGTGLVSLNGINHNQLLTASIQTTQQIDYNLSFQITYDRIVYHDISSTVSYYFIEAPDISGIALYDDITKVHTINIDTTPLDSFDYTIRFSAGLEHYDVGILDLKLLVLERLTTLNGSLGFLQQFSSIYVMQDKNYSFYFYDYLTNDTINELDVLEYTLEYYGDGVTLLDSGMGLINPLNNLYILDFDTESRLTGSYSLIITLGKQNYQTKIGIISLTILKRNINYLLSDNFENNQVNVIKGNEVEIVVELMDHLENNQAIENATVSLLVEGTTHNFQQNDNGTYVLRLSIENFNTFFSPYILNGIINISKENFNSLEFRITVVIEMEQILPGMPTFYFLLILLSLISISGSLVGYKIYKYSKIPLFVKKVRFIKKTIESGKQISESLLYKSKNVFIGEIFKQKWDKIGVSISEILGVPVSKTRKISPMKDSPEEGDIAPDIKPIGLVLMRWNERIGTEILTKHPNTVSISERTLMQIYSTHEYTGEKGIITLMDSNLNILSYYSGSEQGYYLMLILNIDDDPDGYEGGLVNSLQTILQYIENDVYIKMIPSIFQRLAVYPSLNYEQKLMYIYQDEFKRLIIKTLRDDGVIMKSELIVWLRDKYTEGFIDLDAVLQDLIKNDIITQLTLKDMPSELLFLTKDLYMIRSPPVKLLDFKGTGLPLQLTKSYPNDVKKFFSEYHPTEADNLQIINTLTDPEVYLTFKLLRSSIVTFNELEKLKKKGVKDIYSVLKMLWDIKMINVYEDENKKEYYALISDFSLNMIFPKYLLREIKTVYEQKSKTNKVLVEYLNVLEAKYFALKAEKQLYD